VQVDAAQHLHVQPAFSEALGQALGFEDVFPSGVIRSG
jgi:hypothetical protein